MSQPSRERPVAPLPSTPIEPHNEILEAPSEGELERDLRLLAAVGDLLSQPLDAEERLRRLAQLVVPSLADWCALDIHDGKGGIRRVAVHHVDPAKVALAHQLAERSPPRLTDPHGVALVLRTGTAEYVPRLDPQVTAALIPDPEQRRLVTQLDLRSYVIIPLNARGMVLGALTLVFAESGRHYGDRDVTLATEVARRAALALDNARLFGEVQAARTHLFNLFMKAPTPILVTRGMRHALELVNGPFQELAGRPLHIGKPIDELLPEPLRVKLLPLLSRAAEATTNVGEDEVEVESTSGFGAAETRYFNFMAQPLRASSSGELQSVTLFAFEVTQSVRARRAEQAANEALQHRQAELALAADIGLAFTSAQSLQAMLQQCAEAMVKHLGAAFARIWTVDGRGETLELQASAGMYTHLDGAHARVPLGALKIGGIAKEGTPHLTNAVQTDPRVGDREWARREGLVSFAGYPLIVEGKVIGVMAMFGRSALSSQTLAALAAVADSVALGIQGKRAERRALEESETLEALNRVGQSIAAELELDKLVQAVTDAATRLAGAEFGAFFYNVLDERGEAYTLYAISGVPKEAFSKFPMPRNTKVFGPTFAGEGVVRVDDITKDPRYGQNAPHHGMPKGHLPVVSYLAVPVTSRSGRVIGGLFFGHKRPGVFTERAERLVTGVAGMAAIAMDNADLFGKAQRLIKALERTNQDLDQFAYVTSHDLKAPLRGIANLAQWLEEDLQRSLTPDTRRQLDLLRGRVHRMEALIEGILEYSRAGRSRDKAEALDTGRLLAEVSEVLEARPPATVVAKGALPSVYSERVPFLQVLQNLVGNALKHARRPDVRVEVSAEAEGDFWHFVVEDNGPGIAPEFQERVWGIFQTLERRDKVESTGIGLAIVRKIISARGGRAWIESVPGEGARFHFTWPRHERTTA